MISSCILELCALSLLCGAALSLTPEGSVKRVMNILCSVVLIIALVRPVMELDFSAYALELAKYEQREEEFLKNNQELNDRLNRLVIQEGYETYIRDKAEKLGAGSVDITVGLQWSTEGLWVPYRLEGSCTADESTIKQLSGLIETELGIPMDRQCWNG